MRRQHTSHIMKTYFTDMTQRDAQQTFPDSMYILKPAESQETLERHTCTETGLRQLLKNAKNSYSAEITCKSCRLLQSVRYVTLFTSWLSQLSVMTATPGNFPVTSVRNWSPHELRMTNHGSHLHAVCKGLQP